MYRSDRQCGLRGGGVLLYVKSSLQSVEYCTSAEFPEQVWCRIIGDGRNDLLVGICYRTPTESIYGKINHDELRKLITEVKGQHLLLMGDFNYSGIDWETLQSTSTASEDCRLFLDCVEDCFLTQHVAVPTRLGAVLDLVFTEEPDMVNGVENMGRFGSSDHNLLSWEVTSFTRDVEEQREMLDFAKGDFDGMRTELRTVNWDELLQGDADEDWKEFRDLVLRIEKRYVPKRKINNKRQKKAAWLSYRAVKLIRRKHKIFAKYNDNQHPAYVRAAREAAIELRKSRRGFEQKLAANIKNDTRSFFRMQEGKVKLEASLVL